MARVLLLETLANLEAFVRSAEAQSFSAAARELSLTPAAVSRNVAILERHLGVRLFQRTTRKLTLTEAGEAFFVRVVDSLRNLNAAIAEVVSDSQEPVGTLRISVSLDFGLKYIIGLLPVFLQRHPALKIDWRFENRQVDLVRERLDAGIGAGIAHSADIVIRQLAPHHLVTVAAPAFLLGRRIADEPAMLHDLEGIFLRASATGRLRETVMCNGSGQEQQLRLIERIVVSDPAAAVRCALLGMGVTLVAMADALPLLETGQLVRVLPQWYVDLGSINLYYSSRVLLPRRTRVFIDHVVRALESERLIQRFDATSYIPQANG